MPLIYVQRYEKPQAFIEGGTQYVEGALSFAAGTTIYLSEAVFSETGNYILFDYADGTFPGGQAELNSNVTVDASDLLLSGVAAPSGISVLENDTLNSRIILKLVSNPTNGKQFVEGNLDFAGSTTMILSEAMYKTAGTYELFEVTGTISNLSNLSVVSAAGFTAGTPFLVGNIIKVTLV